MIFPAKPFKLRFSIRALLVLMTLLAIWCGYSMNWIRQRRELIDSQVVHDYMLTKDMGATRAAPAMLRLFGEPGHFRLMASVPESDPEFARIQALFPEAKCNGDITMSGE